MARWLGSSVREDGRHRWPLFVQIRAGYKELIWGLLAMPLKKSPRKKSSKPVSKLNEDSISCELHCHDL